MRKLILVLLLFTATACTPDQIAWWSTASDDDQKAVAVHVIEQAAAEYGVDARLMLTIAECESGLRWWARNPSGASGLFQHMPQYWEARAEAIDMPGASIMDPVANARAAANMIAHAGTSAWYPSKHCWAAKLGLTQRAE